MPAPAITGRSPSPAATERGPPPTPGRDGARPSTCTDGSRRWRGTLRRARSRNDGPPAIPGRDRARPSTGTHASRQTPPRLAFDHAEILTRGLDRFRELAERTHLLFALLPERFPRAAVRDALHAVRGRAPAGPEFAAWEARAELEEGGSPPASGGGLLRCTATDLRAPLRPR
ncbi:MAG: hypothetical protein GXY85_02565 [Candidatus Brocadiaceae bacterium]|nr:hypothetical protein [Candidatus Brocadiaceae bacterium]